MDQKFVTFCLASENMDWEFHEYGEKCLHRMKGFDNMENM